MCGRDYGLEPCANLWYDVLVFRVAIFSLMEIMTSIQLFLILKFQRVKLACWKDVKVQMLNLVVNWCRKICSELQECPWWRIVCLVTTAVCLLMVRYITVLFFCYELLLILLLVAEFVADFLQTGSGKTYTMMGEIEETQGCLDEDSGITPRVFDYLFTRIKVVCYLW